MGELDDIVIESIQDEDDEECMPPHPPPRDGSIDDTNELVNSNAPPTSNTNNSGNSNNNDDNRPDMAQIVSMSENMKNTVIRGYMNTICSLLGARSIKKEEEAERRKLELQRKFATKWMHKTFVDKGKGARMRKIAELNYDKRWKRKAFFNLKGKVKKLKAVAHDKSVEMKSIKPEDDTGVTPSSSLAFSNITSNPRRPSAVDREKRAEQDSIDASVKNKKKEDAEKRPLTAGSKSRHDDIEKMNKIDDEETFLYGEDDDGYDDGDDESYRPYFIVIMSIIHVAVFVLEIWASNWKFEPLAINPFFGVSSETLLEFGAKRRLEIVDDGEGWRLFSPIFVHGGVIHLFVNLSVQLRVGIGLERMYGWWRIIPIYFVSGVAGNLGSCLFLPDYLSVGASASLFGLLGALLVEIFQNWKRLESPGTALTQVLVTIFLAIVVGLLPAVDNYAHLFGLLLGIPMSGIFLPTVTLGKWDVKRKLVIVFASLIPLVAFFVIAVPLVYEKKDVHEVCTWCKYLNCVPIKAGWCDAVTITDDQ